MNTIHVVCDLNSPCPFEVRTDQESSTFTPSKELAGIAVLDRLWKLGGVAHVEYRIVKRGDTSGNLR